MQPFRLLLLAALLAGSCAGPTPSAPTEIHSGVSIAQERADDQHASIEIDPEEINAAAAKTFTLTGVVTDRAYSAWKVSGGAVTVTSGPVKARTSSAGKYSVKLRAGIYTLQIAKAGYITATIKKRISANTTLNVPLVPIKPSGATARCKDRTWSKSQNRSGTCSSHKGVAYWVCPGKLCR